MSKQTTERVFPVSCMVQVKKKQKAWDRSMVTTLVEGLVRLLNEELKQNGPKGVRATVAKDVPEKLRCSGVQAAVHLRVQSRKNHVVDASTAEERMHELCARIIKHLYADRGGVLTTKMGRPL